jgi:hypothetical protein
MSEHLNRRGRRLEDKVSHLEHLSVSGQEHKASHSPQNAPEDRDAYAPGQSMPMKQEHVPPTPENTDQPKKRLYKTLSLEGWYHLLGIVGIPFAIAYAIVTGFQWMDLRTNFKADQRAWIGFTEMSITTLKAGEPLRTDVKLLNSGKTFALDIEMPGGVQTSWTGFDDARRQFSQRAPSFVSHSKVLFPGITVNSPAETVEKFTDDQVRAVINGTLKVFLFGDIKYRDIFGGRHTTRYCGHYVASTGRFEDCGTDAN